MKGAIKQKKYRVNQIKVKIGLDNISVFTHDSQIYVLIILFCMRKFSCTQFPVK